MQRKLHIPVIACLISVVAGGAAHADLSQKPLFLQNSVPPNILFVNDDSGSMDFEVLTSVPVESGGSDSILLSNSYLASTPAINNPAPVIHRDRDGNPNTTDDVCNFTAGRIGNNNSHPGYAYVLETNDNTFSGTPCFVAAEEEWRVRSHRFNHLYFDPSQDYQPWPGKPNADIRVAAIDPNKPTIKSDNTVDWSNAIDLLDHTAVLVGTGADSRRAYYNTDKWKNWCISSGVGRTIGINSNCKGWRYYPMKDTNGDGVVDGDEKKPIWLVDLDPQHANDAKVLQNFANWFSYHRKREYVAKYAISTVIDNTSGVRMGFATLNSQNSSRWVQIQGATASKSTLINAVQGVSSNNGTPLVAALENAGKYYKDKDFFGTANVTDPILTEVNGGACQLNNTILMTDGYYTDGSSAANLAAIATKYYNPDGDSDKDFRTYPGIQRMKTYTVAFGVSGSIAAGTDVTAPGFSWPDPTSSDAAKIDDLWHAAVNGKGMFLSAKNSDDLVAALTSAVGDASKAVQSATSVAISSARLITDSKIFFSRFTPGSWDGELLAHTVAANGTVSSTPVWNAAEKLDDETATSRTIITYSANTGMPFAWTSLDTAQQNALTAGSTVTGIGEARLSYLRGNTSNNSFNFRQRESLLGDIINSSPVYVGAPSAPYPDANPFGVSGKRYYDFWNSKKDRTPVVYVGANDGMLHGFRASDGEEVLAYVPATLFPNLHQLTDPNYSHRYFVDQTPTVADAYFAPRRGATSDWRTVLVSGLGAGGRGLFALDITNPADFSEARASDIVLWEFNSSVDSEMGDTVGQPVVAMTEEGRWAVFTGSGYASAERGSVATLFIIYLDANPSDGWQLGTDYRKISLPVVGPGIAARNGLFSPAVIDTNGDGYADRVYAGDMSGNLWAFTLKGAANTWDVAYKNGSTPIPLFKAKNAAAKIQPITTKPSVIRHPQYPTIVSDTLSDNTEPNLMILFGTGEYLTNDAINVKETQSFYGVWDKGQGGLTRDNLIAQTITSGTAANQQNVEARLTSANTVPYGNTTSTQRFGWRIDLDTSSAATGERVISNAVVINDTAFFTTYIPDSTPCSSGGSSWFMFVNASNGATPSKPVVSINNDRLVNEDDLVSLIQNGQKSAPSGLLIEGTLGSPTIALDPGANSVSSTLIHADDGVDNLATDIGGIARGKRISWRELRAE